MGLPGPKAICLSIYQSINHAALRDQVIMSSYRLRAAPQQGCSHLFNGLELMNPYCCSQSTLLDLLRRPSGIGHGKPPSSSHTLQHSESAHTNKKTMSRLNGNL